MEIIKNFGIDWYLLGAQIINFLILAFLLKRFAYKPIIKLLQDRKNMIAESVKNAQVTKDQLQKALDEEKNILKKAQATAQEILLDAKKQADITALETKEQTKVQVEKMIEDAKQSMEQSGKSMEKQLALSTATLAVAMLKDALQDVFTTKEQQEVIAKVSKNLKVK